MALKDWAQQEQSIKIILKGFPFHQSINLTTDYSKGLFNILVMWENDVNLNYSLVKGYIIFWQFCEYFAEFGNYHKKEI